MDLQGEDLELYNRLREKYQGANGTMPSDPNAPGAELWQPLVPVPATKVSGAKGANVDVRICPVCQGAGTHVELYQHRRLQKFCTSCAGRGVTVYRDGVEVVEGEGRDTQQQADNHASPTTANDEATGRPQHPIVSSMAEEEIERVQVEIRALEDKDSAYSKELQKAECDLQACDNPAERQLREALVLQLAAQIKRVRAGKARKEAQLRLAGR